MKAVNVIGLLGDESQWVRMLVALLRHPDPLTAELTREAILYLAQTADQPPDSFRGRQPRRGA